jgi:hypothetical protein
MAKNYSRHATSVQGLLIKKHYPGLVTIEGREIVPEKWHHFFLVKDVKTDEVLADKIKREFWVSLCIAPHISILRIRWTFFKQ